MVEVDEKEVQMIVWLIGKWRESQGDYIESIAESSRKIPALRNHYLELTRNLQQKFL